MKIAIYGIMKNEAKHIERFAKACEDADEIVILDTGSDDDSVKIAEDFGISVDQSIIDPWRFDVARNAALDRVSDDADLCISIDLDEVIQPGWRELIEQKWVIGNNCLYSWHRNQDNYRYRKIRTHSRRNWFWRHPVHELICCSVQKNPGYTDMIIDHIPDHTKSRTQYIDLLRLAISETPKIARLRLFLVTELIKHGEYDEANEMIEKVISCEMGWTIEHSYACWVAYYLHNRTRLLSVDRPGPDLCEWWLSRGIFFAPLWRESWFKLAKYLYENGRYQESFNCASTAMTLQNREYVSYSDLDAWNGTLHLIAAQSAEALGKNSDADINYNIAIRRYPEREDIAIAYAAFLAKTRK